MAIGCLLTLLAVDKGLKRNWVNPSALDPLRPGGWEIVGGKRVLHVPPDEFAIEYSDGHVEFRKARNADEVRRKALAIQAEKDVVTQAVTAGRPLDPDALNISEENRRAFDKVREHLINGKFFRPDYTGKRTGPP